LKENFKILSALIAIAIALGLISISIVFVANSQISNMDSQIQTLNETINDLRNDLNSLQQEFNIIRESYYPLLVKDALDRVVTIKSEPMRIVSCTPTITETLFALGLSEKIVGVDSYSDYPEEVVTLREQGKIAVVGGVTTLDPEAVAAQTPDLVVIDASLQSRFIPTLEGFGLTVIALEAKSVDNVKENFKLLAKVTFKLSEGARLVNELESVISNVSSKVSQISNTKTLFLVWHDPMYAAGNETYLNELISIAGGENMVTRNGWVVVNPEEVVAANPGVIILSSMSLPLNPDEMFSYFNSLPGFEHVDAIKNNRVYILTEGASNAVERAGPRLMDGLQILAYILHPEIFGIDLPHVLGDDYANYLNT